MTTTTATTTDLANVPHPAGATAVFEWYDTQPGPYSAQRYFRGGSWVVERDNRDTDMCVQVDGVQNADGRVERFVVLDDDNLNPVQARQLGAALLAAADEVDRATR
jgi:hypothetical protein